MSTPIPPTAAGFVTARHIADFYAVSPPTIYNWAKDDKIPSLRFESTVRFDFNAVRAAIEHRGICRWGIDSQHRSEIGGFHKIGCGDSCVPRGDFALLEALSPTGQVLNVALGIFSQQNVSLLAKPPNHWSPNEDWELDGWYETYDLLVEFLEKQ